jgi:hypothetical protein
LPVAASAEAEIHYAQRENLEAVEVRELGEPNCRSIWLRPDIDATPKHRASRRAALNTGQTVARFSAVGRRGEKLDLAAETTFYAN